MLITFQIKKRMFFEEDIADEKKEEEEKRLIEQVGDHYVLFTVVKNAFGKHFSTGKKMSELTEFCEYRYKLGEGLLVLDLHGQKLLILTIIYFDTSLPVHM